MPGTYRWLVSLALACVAMMLACSLVVAQDFPRSAVDDVGIEVFLPGQPQRIVSLAPANTEILFAVGAGSRVVGVTTYCDFPEEAIAVSKIGDYVSPSIELIISLCPDLVLGAYGNGEDNLARLRSLGYQVAALHPGSLSDVLDNITLVSWLTGQDPGGRSLVHGLKERIDKVVEKRSLFAHLPPRVWYVVWYPELWSAGHDTFANGLLETIGAHNIAGDIDGWKILSKETVIIEDPEVILCSAMDNNRDYIRQSILEDSQLAGVSAVRSGRVHTFDPDIVERPGPRVVDGLEQLFHLVYDDEQ